MAVRAEAALVFRCAARVEEELLAAAGREQRQQVRVLVPFDDERVRNLSGQEDERSSTGLNVLVSDPEPDVAREDPERLVFTVVDVQRRGQPARMCASTRPNAPPVCSPEAFTVIRFGWNQVASPSPAGVRTAPEHQLADRGRSRPPTGRRSRRDDGRTSAGATPRLPAGCLDRGLTRAAPPGPSPGAVRTARVRTHAADGLGVDDRAPGHPGTQHRGSRRSVRLGGPGAGRRHHRRALTDTAPAARCASGTERAWRYPQTAAAATTPTMSPSTQWPVASSRKATSTSAPATKRDPAQDLPTRTRSPAAAHPVGSVVDTPASQHSKTAASSNQGY